MNKIAKLNILDREALFRNTAEKMGINEAVVEKDFWVCVTLDYLFHRCKWKNNLAFKGGTSLSKAYGLIERFSEDVDLILDWRVIGYDLDEPWIDRSNTKQDKFNKEANARTEIFLREEFLPEISRDLSNELGAIIECLIDPFDPQTVKFNYPRSFENQAILPEIRLEIGALAAWTPTKWKSIEPYAATYYDNLFERSSTEILTVLPERTFWEKVTILHREAYRSAQQKFPERYSRHYYDLYCMMDTDVATNALADTDLLNKVVTFKEKFYRCSWAKYDEAKRGSMRLTPPEYNVERLQADYIQMQSMIFGKRPSFDDLMGAISTLETEINTIG